MLTFLDLEYSELCPGGVTYDEELPEIARTIARLEFLRMPVLTENACASVNAAIGPALWYWAPNSCRFSQYMTANSLPHLESLEFPEVPIFSPEPSPDRTRVITAFIYKLASLQPSLRRVVLSCSRLESETTFVALLAAFPSIQELDLSLCDPITDITLAALQEHPPLHCLSLEMLPKVTAPAITSFLRARGSKLSYLSANWLGGAPFEALASYAPVIEQIVIS
ncbi:hypothetical protein BDK51DRAFT_34863 [Blyttiomyces helicus]|uniref:F-box domain-containing protein n=1 Tax=Blyttiomyces helicus TaxID=388810 RepID=A0A4P9WAT5_9FUNG|nr:hypothetical protein BDK51DRAFT_34863 [Blyttiomyces helicus]|eukprot:RKO88685.1 hypothetical protein BDK51DRAFT_34863 [Blyttiomyces helicus]